MKPSETVVHSEQKNGAVDPVVPSQQSTQNRSAEIVDLVENNTSPKKEQPARTKKGDYCS